MSTVRELINQLTDVYNSFDTLLQNTDLTKTPQSKNITLSDWNKLVHLCELYFENVKQVYSLLPYFINYNSDVVDKVEDLDGIKEALENIKSIQDAYIGGR